MGLNEFEYSRIVELMGREPNLTELGMFAVMWSEHCGYKYSRPVLALFAKYKQAMEGSGLENAGIVDIGDGIGITMKVESHNHPSAVEPYQGAATGVGGIIRDILTMGARPIACLNSLRFGPIEGDSAEAIRNRYLFEHVVAGIGGYGNCVGVPTVAGEVNFHPRYSGNPLVNAMCVGVLDLSEVTTAAASGDGNPVIYIGSATGKDGIHGATFASEALDEESEAKRPNVQIGDPFAEKLLIEATLEALNTGAIVAIQDMGAAGLTCSTIEMSAKGNVGMDIDLDKVPMRESDMTAYELMLSESQERMLAVAVLGREDEVLRVFRKWGLRAEVIGWVNEEGETVVRRHGEVAARLTARWLADMCPTYSPAFEVPAYFESAKAFVPPEITMEPKELLLKLLASPNIASKKWVTEQYDQTVQTQTALKCGEGDAAVLAIRGSKKGIAVKIDGNGRQIYYDPFVGGALAVCEAARNVACTGAKPVAVTDGLNFGNPQKPHVYWQFKEAIRGIAEACEIMDTPVISGNVSFYNESELGEVLPTPLIGMLGIIEDVNKRTGMSPKGSGSLALVSTPLHNTPQLGLGASETLAVLGIENGVPVPPNLYGEKGLCRVLVEAVSRGLIECAHDCAEGGLAVALAEMAISGNCGIDVKAGDLFSELPGRVIVGKCGQNWQEFQLLCEESGLQFEELGTFDEASSRFQVSGAIEIELSELKCAYDDAIPHLMSSERVGKK